MPKGRAIKMDDDWEAEDALRTLCRAEKIRRDTKLLVRVKKLAVMRKEELKEITGVMPEED